MDLLQDLEHAKRVCDETRILPWPWPGPLSCDQSLLTLSILLCTLVTGNFVYNQLGRRKRKALEIRLDQALRTVRDLEDKLLSLEANDADSKRNDLKDGKEIRIWLDGAFDMMHFGHMNAFRQARALGTYLIAGINSSETITAAKGAPVNDDEERCATVAGCKWVDEVVPDVPYVMSEAYLNMVIEKYKIDYIVHGDDPCIVDGKDVYEGAKRAGKYLEIPRTEGISTTDIVGRMLLLSKDHHVSSPAPGLKQSSSHPLITEQVRPSRSGSWGTAAQEPVDDVGPKLASDKGSEHMPYFRRSNFLATSRILRLFGAGVKSPKATDRVIYLAGGWDMFHAGHVATLKKARELGDYIIVGVHNDYEVNRRRGLNYPIMSLHERVLSVLGCKWVDDVLIDAPYSVTEDMIASLKINVVVKGTVADSSGGMGSEGNSNGSSPSTPPRRTTDNNDYIDIGPDGVDLEDPFAVPRRLGILQVVQSTQGLTVPDIVGRIHMQRVHFDAKFNKKKRQEEEFWRSKRQES